MTAHAPNGETARQQWIEQCFRGRLTTKNRQPEAEALRKDAAALLELASLESLDLRALVALVAQRPPSAEALVFLVHSAGKRAIATKQRQAAESKNMAARLWVGMQWQQRPELKESKAAFSRRIAPVVKRRFKAKVSPEWIARHWVPPGDGLDGLLNLEPGTVRIAWTGRFHERR